MRKYFHIFLLALALCSCGEYNRALKSKDVDYKFEYAKRAFEEGKYAQASSILTDVITPLKGGPKFSTNFGSYETAKEMATLWESQFKTPYGISSKVE